MFCCGFLIHSAWHLIIHLNEKVHASLTLGRFFNDFVLSPPFYFIFSSWNTYQITAEAPESVPCISSFRLSVSYLLYHILGELLSLNFQLTNSFHTHTYTHTRSISNTFVENLNSHI